MASIPGYQLPVQHATGGRKAQGFMTPLQDKRPQKVSVLPRRVLPIISLPGIMGSNLRLSAGRQKELKKENNIAWRPDRASECAAFLVASAYERQLFFDPDETEVDIYAANAPTGSAEETSEKRNDNVEVDFMLPLEVGNEAMLLTDDPPIFVPHRNARQKAFERGWGEVFFDSYGELLRCCESRLYSAFKGGNLHPWWRNIVDVDPADWQAAPESKLLPLTENELKKALSECWFPVHAMGYNWLKSSWQSGIDVAKRINKLIADYVGWGFQCEKVVVVTHSMGGLVARAVIHPNMGNLQDKVLGVVHGVMPAVGAAAAYKRM